MKKTLLLLTCLFFASIGFAQTDLVITNTNNQNVYVPGTSVKYTITVTNFGPNAANSVHTVCPIPAGITTYYWEGSNFSFGSASDTVDAVDDTEFYALPVGGVLTYTVFIEIPSDFTGPLTLAATVTSAASEVNASTNQATDTDLIANADIAVTNTDYTNIYTSGQASVYTLTVTNNGPTDAVHVIVKNTVPIGLDEEVMSWSGTNGTSGTGINLDDVIDFLPVGASVVYTVTLNIPASFNGILINKANIYSSSTDPNMANNTVTDTDAKAFGADLVIVNTDNKANYVAGQPNVYTVTVTNAGPETATGVVVFLPAPAGTTITSWSGTNGSSGTDAVQNTIASLAVGAVVTYTVTVDIPSAFTGNLTTEVAVTSDLADPNPCEKCTDTDSAGADIQVINTDGVATYQSGGTQTYTLTVTNAGPNDAQNVRVSDTFPAGVNVVSWNGSNGSNGGGNFGDTILLLSNGQSVTYTITVTIPASFTGNLVSQASVTSDTPDPVPACSQCTDTDTQALADISVVNTDGAATYNVGIVNSKTYTVTVTNNGPADTRNVQVSFAVPATATQVSWFGNNGTSGTGTLNTLIAALSSGASVVYTVSLQIPASVTGNFTTTASVSTTITNDLTAANNSSPDIDTPQNTADVILVNTNNIEVYTAGTANVYTVTVTNKGPSTATGVNVIFPLPAGTTSMSWTGNSTSGSTALDDTIGTLLAGQSVTYTVTVNIPATFTGSLTAQANIASTTSIDPVTACARCTDIDTDGVPQADVVITNTDNQSFYVANSTRVYTLTVTNNGPQAATQVHVQNPLPAGITTMTWTSTATPSGSGAIDETIPSLANGESIVYTVTITVPASFTGSLVNTATVSTTPVDSSTTNNTATDTDAVMQSDIVVTNTASNPTAPKGSTAQFTVTVTNNGPQTATGVSVSNAIPAGVTVMSWTGSNGSSGTGAVADVIQMLTVGGTVTYTITITVPNAASVSSTASATLASDPNAANSQATATITPTSLAGNDISVTITDGSPTYVSGQNRVFTVTVTNNGATAASNVQVSSIVPGRISPVGYVWSGNSAAGNTGAISDIIGTLNAGQSVVYTITVSVPSDFPQNENLINSVTVTASNDPVSGNNTATDLDTPSPFANLVVNKTDNSPTYEQTSLVDDNIYDTTGAVEVKKYVTYTISVVNYGPSDSYNIQVTDNLPQNTNIGGAPITAADVKWAGNGASGTGVLQNTINHLAVGEIVTYTVTVFIPMQFQVYSTPPTPQVDSSLINTVTVSSSTPDPVISNNTSTDIDTPAPRIMFFGNNAAQFGIDHDPLKLAQGYVENVLIRSHCANVSNFQMFSKDGINSSYGIGYFKRQHSDFPIEDGIVLICGGLIADGDGGGAKGPNTSIVDGPPWGGSSDFNTGYMTPGVNIPLNSTNDQSYLQFDFVPSAQEMSFNFIFASEEYSRNIFECTYSDVFAFILTDNATPTVHKNLAVVPNTNIPVKVTSIHQAVPPNVCTAVNPQYFGKYNWDPADPSVAANAAHNFNGQTENLVASATVIPGHSYTIKLIIANQDDHSLASAVFIQGGSFKFEAQVTGDGPLAGIDDFTGDNAVCGGQSRRIKYGNEALPSASYSWLRNGVRIDGATDYFYDVTLPGIYTAVVTFATGCQKTDDIEVRFTEPLPTKEPKDIPICKQDAPFVFNLDQTNYILNGFSPADFPVTYYENEQDAIDEGNNDILTLYGNLDNYIVNDPAALPKTIYVRIANMGSGSGCVDIKPVVLTREFSEGQISYADTPHCVNGGTVPVIPSAAFTSGGYYEATPGGLDIDFLTGEVDLNNSQSGTYTIKYKIPEGTCDAYESDPVTFVVSGCLVTVLEPIPPICAGETFNLVTSAVNQASVTYTWSDANGVIGTTDVPHLDNITAPATGGSYTYSVVASVGTESSAASTQTLVVNDIPVVTISGPNNVCTNDVAQIVFSGPAGTSVKFTDGTTETIIVIDSTLSYPFDTPALSAPVTYQIVDVTSDTAPACSQTIVAGTTDTFLTITVGLPDAEITGPAVPTICADGTINIDVHGTSDATVHYTITNSSGTQAGTPLVLDASGDGVIEVSGITETTTYELVDVTTSCFASLTGERITITVNPLPVVTSFTATTATVCEGTDAAFDIVGTGGATVNFHDSNNATFSYI
ncbi:MAG: hypothetical protein CFE23_05890, partial [Flavobacterium sp. BFFFF1]|uniref:choice-of-anchor L domain-containing protein n=1 Tax=Flavobacterium sp. BFFFF1 TaxID=2015557 RepID=UPI000BD59C7B